MNILCACEESQAVTKELRRLGHNAFSCDIIPESGGHPEWHIQGDCIPLINGFCTFWTRDGSIHTIEGRWDMLIAFPPCTYLTVSGNRYYSLRATPAEKVVERMEKREAAAIFFMRFALADCPRIAIENPVGHMSRVYRKPDQIIQPFLFGHPYTKQTCLWLKNLPLLIPTDILEKPPQGWENQQITNGRYSGYGGTWGAKFNGKWRKYGDPEVKKIRSKTFPGIARAMAEQWAGEVKA